MSYSKQARGSFESVSKRIPEGVKVYLPVLPVTALVGLFILYPIAQAIYSSFFNKDLLAPSEAEFIGLANYAEIWSNPTIHQVLWNTLIWVVVGSSAAIVLGFLMGWLLHEKLPYTSVASAIVLIPWVLPRVVGASIWQFMFGGSQGIINELLVQLGVIDEYIVMLGSTELSLWPPIIGMIWRLAPLFALLTLTSLQGIDEHLYEAARMDGATPWEQFRFITIPMMRYNLAIGFLLMLIYNIRNFSMIWVMTKGGPGVSSSTLPVMIYRTAFVDFDVGLASALSLILFVVLLVFSYYYIQVYDQVRGDV
ncbi:carbohydrate ABC transporter permease [Haloferax volcanii]|uniref:ABC-type transport system permease protein (Substrate L-rhamnose) n=4 Tax=Haloferax TaxID=2251 RepID=D4GPA9_HALVD|nr:sugar ABC transporter permease [Haloferax volcanii]ADE01476.1 ABC-type transport system permease protein (substrate L-rhamnose) [Haloferax volcanii DS2]ELY36725.1 sugar ABC transporter permease [Haloferax volcanii DS2]MBS8118189.1 sugar ABC transporter permease [Haloferax volcanii]MBS8123201.1 sugar ABC transporter permease [Haloferax volcanii]MBS8127069.1 sugar ABC transporter permease [Haloferax volcanii]